MDDNGHRKQINIRLEPELYEFLLKYSKDNYKTVTAVVREMIANLFKQSKESPIIIKNEK